MTERLNIKSLLVDFFKDKKLIISAYMIFILAYPIGNIVGPHYYGKLLEQVTKKNKNISKTFAITLFFWALAIGGFYGLSKIDSYIIPKLRSHLYSNIAAFVFEIHKENYSSLKIGELVSKLSKLPYLVLEVMYQVRTCVLPLIYMSVFCIIYFFVVNKKLGALVTSIIIAFFAVAFLSVKMCMPSCVNAENAGDLANENLQDILENILNVYTSDNVESELKSFAEKDNELSSHMKGCLDCASKFKLIFSCLYLVSFLVICMYAYHLLKTKQITISQISSVVIVMVYLLAQIDSTMQYMQDTISYIGSIFDIQAYIDGLNLQAQNTRQEIAKANDAFPQYKEKVDNIEGKIEFRNIRLVFGDKNILDNFSYTIMPKKKVALVGKIGSGKSSLIKMILKLLYPTSGQVLIDGKNLSYKTVRHFTSYITQTPVLFNRPLIDNILYGTGKTRQDVEELLQKYDLDIFGSLDASVGKGGSNLSGGQRQTVLILRAVLKNSSIILLDEPTTALDSEMRDIILNLIFKVFHDKTLIMITHDPELLPKFDEIIRLV